jgi:hypothetical protein
MRERNTAPLVPAKIAVPLTASDVIVRWGNPALAFVHPSVSSAHFTSHSHTSPFGSAANSLLENTPLNTETNSLER